MHLTLTRGEVLALGAILSLHPSPLAQHLATQLDTWLRTQPRPSNHTEEQK